MNLSLKTNIALVGLLVGMRAFAIDPVAAVGQWGLYAGAGTGKVLQTFATANACVAGATQIGKSAAYTCKAAVTVTAPLVSPPSPSTVTAWVRLTTEGNNFNVTGPVRYGDGAKWVVKPAAGAGACSVKWFSSDPAYGVAKFCDRQITAPAVVQVPGQMPVVNTALAAPPGPSFDGPRVRRLSLEELAMPVFQTPPSDIGAFRTGCGTSKQGDFDPIMFPGKSTGGHFHTFQGNSSVSGSSTAGTLATTGNSTCSGGTLNRTAYWMPSLIDIRTGQPLVPTSTSFYYKGGYLGVDPRTIVPPPLGLRMIAGDASNVAPISSPNQGVECVSGGGHQPKIPNCAVGDELNVSVIFPQCWDGKNLDSPDHKSHMAYATGRGCPATHPVSIPEIALNTHYQVDEANSGQFLRFSSDKCVGFGGCSLHADWFMAWDEATIRAFVVNCINAKRDCHSNLLGDGRTLF